MLKNMIMNKRIKSFKYAIRGLSHVVAQPNMLIHMIIAFMVILAGLALKLKNTDWILVILAIGMVLAAESFNTSIEKLTDIVSPNQNEAAGRVKDISAGAVLICAVTAAIIGLFVFIPALISIIKTL
jgi:diacylglycerol kinase (ATP)